MASELEDGLVYVIVSQARKIMDLTAELEREREMRILAQEKLGGNSNDHSYAKQIERLLRIK